MTTEGSPPPYVLDSARVLRYAILDASVSYTGRISIYVDGKRLGPVPRLALCENLAQDDDYLLLYCNDDWEVLGAGGFGTLQEALAYAEAGYAGVGGKWQAYRPLRVEELAYIQEVKTFVRKDTPDGPYPEPPSVV